MQSNCHYRNVTEGIAAQPTIDVNVNVSPRENCFNGISQSFSKYSPLIEIVTFCTAPPMILQSIF